MINVLVLSKVSGKDILNSLLLAFLALLKVLLVFTIDFC